MAQNLIIHNTIYNGVDSIEMTNTAGEKVLYTEHVPEVVGDPVAQIGSTQYTSVADALAAAKSGDTVQMVADSAEGGNLIVPTGVTLDLNGKTLTADNLVSSGVTFDSSSSNYGGIGRLYVDKNSLFLSNANTQIPVWMEDNSGNYYLFAKVEFGTKVQTNGTNSTYSIAVYLADTALKSVFADGGANNNLTVKVLLRWENAETGNTMEQYYTAADEQLAALVGGSLVLTVTGVDWYGSSLRFMPVLEGSSASYKIEFRGSAKNTSNQKVDA